MRLGNNVLLGFILNVLLISIGGVELVVITRSVHSWVISGYLISSDRGSLGQRPGNSWRPWRETCAWRHSHSVWLSVVRSQDEADQFFTGITYVSTSLNQYALFCIQIFPQLSWHHQDLMVTTLHSSSWNPCVPSFLHLTRLLVLVERVSTLRMVAATHLKRWHCRTYFPYRSWTWLTPGNSPSGNIPIF